MMIVLVMTIVMFLMSIFVGENCYFKMTRLIMILTIMMSVIMILITMICNENDCNDDSLDNDHLHAGDDT